MDDATLVRTREASGDLARIAERVVKGERVRHLLAKGHARDELHGDEEVCVPLADLVDRRDVAVGQHRGGPSLPKEASSPLAIGRERAREHLERDIPPELLVVRPVHDAHPTATELGIDAEVSQLRAEETGHRSRNAIPQGGMRRWSRASRSIVGSVVGRPALQPRRERLPLDKAQLGHGRAVGRGRRRHHASSHLIEHGARLRRDLCVRRLGVAGRPSLSMASDAGVLQDRNDRRAVARGARVRASVCDRARRPAVDHRSVDGNSCGAAAGKRGRQGDDRAKSHEPHGTFRKNAA